MKYFSIFSGIGGFELGIQQAYNDIKSNRKQQKNSKIGTKKSCFIVKSKKPNKSKKWGNISCIGYSEINKYAIQVYQKHFPKHKNYGDATKIDTKQLPDFDLLVGGFPCQAFSIAGKRKGFDDTRGTLFFEIARVLRDKRPRYFLLENVKGLLSHDFGKTFQTILGILTDLGYGVQWQVLNSKNFGVPQNRERVFIVGHFRGTSRPKVFPIGESSQGNLKEITKDKSQGARIYKTDGIAQTMSSGGGGQGGKTGLYAVASRGRHLENGKRKDVLGAKTQQRMEKRNDDLMNCLSSIQKDGMLSDGVRIRRLTPTECERLQGFPDNLTEGVSDTQRYKCLGNAVTVNVIKEIMAKIIN